MRVRAADAERTHAGPARRLASLPLREPGVHVKRAVREIYLRIGRFEVQAGREFLVVQREHGLDQTRGTRGSVEVADVRLHRADGAEIPGARSGIQVWSSAFRRQRAR